MQLVALEDDDLQDVGTFDSFDTEADGSLELEISMSDEQTMLLVFSAVTEGTTLPAEYEYTIEVVE